MSSACSRITPLLGGLLVLVGSSLALAQPGSAAKPVAGGCEPALGARLILEGSVGGRVDAVRREWVLRSPRANPALITMFRDRDVEPLRNLLPWSGEFVGKHLTGACELADLLEPEARDELTADLKRLASALLLFQDADGYLGPFPRSSRLAGSAPNVDGKNGPTWDAWGHYHVMLGLMSLHELTNDPQYLEAARKIGLLLTQRFLDARAPDRLVDTGSTEMNLAPAHALCLLHEKTGDPQFRQLAAQLVTAEFAATDSENKPLAGNYLAGGLEKVPFYKLPRPRWESLHPIMALAELYRIEGDARYRTAFENLWWSIVETDRHNNGGFSSGEQAQGNPYHQGAIETCCTIAWLAMTVDMLRLNADARIADELELSTLNSVMGLWHPSGQWSTYNTPMDGVRLANFHEIVFQSRPGSPELNCCSVNAARGLGLVSKWALMRDEEGLIVNWFGRSRLMANLADGTPIAIEVDSDYPRDGRVRLVLHPAHPASFGLKLRIPQWSEQTRVQINAKESSSAPIAGRYLALQREWSEGDVIELQLDMRPHVWQGSRELAGRASLYRGPILLAFDRADNPDLAEPDPIPLDRLRVSEPVEDATGTANLRVEYTQGGQVVRLRDFASAGADGSSYRSWLRVESPRPSTFSRTRPIPTARP